ncbi:MAG: putative glycolipid-binding domain-containing protein [Chloroflexi bacterium]|nr:putative glycolipid-binding domain-containing protein [Chloroflexota bacterium]
MLNNPLRTVLWQRIVSPGSEWCALEREPDGWQLQGIVLAEAASAPVLVQYVVALGADWSTRAVQIVMRSGAVAELRALKITVDFEQRWQTERKPTPDPATPPDDLEALHGLIDVDLGFSPVTNTLPIRRLDPAIGGAVDVVAAWVRFPELTIGPLPQRYIRLAERRYRYESAGGAFVAEIEVDDLGLATTYEGGWQRIAASPDH